MSSIKHGASSRGSHLRRVLRSWSLVQARARITGGEPTLRVERSPEVADAVRAGAGDSGHWAPAHPGRRGRAHGFPPALPRAAADHSAAPPDVAGRRNPPPAAAAVPSAAAAEHPAAAAVPSAAAAEHPAAPPGQPPATAGDPSEMAGLSPAAREISGGRRRGLPAPAAVSAPGSRSLAAALFSFQRKRTFVFSPECPHP
jgi:hypothetical protein